MAGAPAGAGRRRSGTPVNVFVRAPPFRSPFLHPTIYLHTWTGGLVAGPASGRAPHPEELVATMVPSTKRCGTLSAVLEQHARRRPEAEALVWGATRLTYAELNAWANQIANALAVSGFGAAIMSRCCARTSRIFLRSISAS